MKHCRRALQREEPATLVARYPVLRNKCWHPSKFSFLCCSPFEALHFFHGGSDGAAQGCNCITAKRRGESLTESLAQCVLYFLSMGGANHRFSCSSLSPWAASHCGGVFSSTKITVLTKPSVVRATFLILQLVFGSDEEALYSKLTFVYSLFSVQGAPVQSGGVWLRRLHYAH